MVTQDEIKVELIVSGFDAHEDVTKLVGLKPTKIIHKGEGIRTLQQENPQSALYTENMWILSSGGRESLDIETQLDLLLDKLWPLRTQVSDLNKKYEAEVSVHGYVYHSQLGMHIKPELFKRLASLNLPLDLDIYTLESED
ncbi:MAG TPA: DUF4279 domain-containing protein [Nevskiaceae bacterium]|nr:DUF4279 domain-containing protein [Nevskiaceae bacterium]